MPAAFLPSPASSLWHLGPIPLRAFSLCMVAGVLAGLWLTDRRYRKAGGQEGVILAVATIAVPVGIVGARIYSVVTNAHLYFGGGRDWVDVLRFWNGGLGIAGAVAAGAIAAWAYCRRAGIELGPLALAAAPALPVAQAIAVWGNWFTQSLYGRPSSLPWAVAIAPAKRAVGYQAFATFQPIFLYESALYLLVALAVIYGIRRWRLTGDRAFALYAGLYATVRFFAEAQRVDDTPRLFGMRTNEVALLATLIVAWSYLLLVRSRRYRQPIARLAAATATTASRPVQALRPRSDSGLADRLAHQAGTARAARPDPAGPAGAPDDQDAAGQSGQWQETAGAAKDAEVPQPLEPGEPAAAADAGRSVTSNAGLLAAGEIALARRVPAQPDGDQPLPPRPAGGPVTPGAADPAPDAQLLS
jgi:prolipoprotein diacylglyceryl transferase